jgi:hypothetical protein
MCTACAAVDHIPEVEDDVYSAVEGDTLVVDAEHGVLANDDAHDMVAYLVDGPQDAELSFNLDGSFNFTYDELANITFTYLAANSIGNSTIATVTIVVGASCLLSQVTDACPICAIPFV